MSSDYVQPYCGAINANEGYTMTIMKRYKHLSAALLIGAVIPMVAMPSITYAQGQKTTAQKLAEVTSHLKAVSTMTANFVQTNRLGQSVNGTMILKRPGKLRFQYKNDASLLIVADGRALNMIDYEVNQVQSWPIKNSPLSVLLDPNKDLSKFGKIIPTANDNVVSVEVRDPKRPEYGVITMFFNRRANAPAGLNLVGWVALDSKNNRTTVQLSNVKFNISVKSSAFRWRDPRRRSRGPRR